MISTRASDNGVVVCYVNMVGGQDELVFDGHSLIFDERGALIARGGAVPRGAAGPRHRRRWRRAVAAARSADGGATALGTNRGGATRASSCPGRPSRRSERRVTPALAEPLDDVAEVWEALVLATRDYVHKTGFETVVVALSGGIDSSLVAAVAAEALGPEHVVGVSMPSRFSSEGSRTDARATRRATSASSCMMHSDRRRVRRRRLTCWPMHSRTRSSVSPRRTSRRASAAT